MRTDVSRALPPFTVLVDDPDHRPRWRSLSGCRAHRTRAHKKRPQTATLMKLTILRSSAARRGHLTRRVTTQRRGLPDHAQARQRITPCRDPRSPGRGTPAQVRSSGISKNPDSGRCVKAVHDKGRQPLPWPTRAHIGSPSRGRGRPAPAPAARRKQEIRHRAGMPAAAGTGMERDDDPRTTQHDTHPTPA